MSTPWIFKVEDLPHIASPTKAKPLDHLGASYTGTMSGVGRGAITVSRSNPVYSSVISSTEGSLIVAYQGNFKKAAFFARRVEESTDESGNVSITGPSIHDVLYRTEVEPYSSGMPDWYWGADSILGNGGFEESLEETDDDGEDATGTGVFVPTYWELSVWGPMASNGFQVITTPDPVQTGTYALKMNPLAQFAGVQQRVRVVGGGIYQAGISNIKPTLPDDDYTLVIRDSQGNLIGSRDDRTSSVTWYDHSLTDVTIPAGVDEIIFRFAYIGTGNPSPNYLDDAFLMPGFAKANVGEILDALLDRANTRGALTWLDRTSWTTSLDSSGAAWDADIAFTATHGRSIGQVLDQLSSLGYEWDVTWNGTSWALDVYNPGNMGSATATSAILMGRDIAGGSLTRNEPAATVVRAEGSDGITTTVQDVTAITNWDRREKFVQDSSINDAATLSKFAQSQLDTRLTVDATRFEIFGGTNAEPLVDFNIGDIVQTVTSIGNNERRVHSWTVNISDKIVYQVDLDGVVLNTDGAQAEGLRRLLVKFEELSRADVGGPVSSGGLVPIGTPDVLIAAFDAPPTWKDAADFICDFVNDESQFNAAALLIASRNGGSPIQREQGIVLSPGQFKLQGKLDFATASEVSFIRGVSPPDGNVSDVVTIIQVNLPGGTTGTAIDLGQCNLIDIDFEWTNVASVAVGINGGGAYNRHVRHKLLSAGTPSSIFWRLLNEGPGNSGAAIDDVLIQTLIGTGFAAGKTVPPLIELNGTKQALRRSRFYLKTAPSGAGTVTMGPLVDIEKADVCTITDMQVEIAPGTPTFVAGTPGDGLIKIADLATPKVKNVLIANVVGRVTYATPPTGVVGINATNQPAGRVHVMGDSFAVAGIANPVVRTAAVTNLAGTGIYGTTAQRPGATSVPIGQHYFDTTLGYEIHSDGTNWVNSAGTTV